MLEDARDLIAVAAFAAACVIAAVALGGVMLAVFVLTVIRDALDRALVSARGGGR